MWLLKCPTPEELRASVAMLKPDVLVQMRAELVDALADELERLQKELGLLQTIRISSQRLEHPVTSTIGLDAGRCVCEACRAQKAYDDWLRSQPKAALDGGSGS